MTRLFLQLVGRALLATVFFFALASGIAARADAIVFSDDFESFSAGTDVTVAMWTPAVGPLDSASFHIFPPESISTKTVVDYSGSLAVNINLPIGAGMEYHGILPETYSHTVLRFGWDLTVPSLNSGLGGVWIRFPSPTYGMQILMGYFDNGLIGTFSSDPSLSSLVPIGSFQAGLTYHTSLDYDLSGSRYSVYVDGTPLLLDEPLPAYLNQTDMDSFGFDGSEDLQGSQGNVWIIDNISVSLLPEPSTIGLIGTGFLLGFRVLRRRRMR